ncbi:hypothetical protein D3C87_1601690 [compost metagenome]
MHECRYLTSERFLGFTSPWVSSVTFAKCFKLFFRKECVDFSVINHTLVIDVQPKLVKLVDARLFRIEPDRTVFGLAELLTSGFIDN